MTKVVTRFKGLNKIRKKGRTYVYLRATGYAFKAAFGSPEFLAEYLAVTAALPPKAAPRSLGAMIAAYRASHEFLGLAARTRQQYDDVFHYLKPNHALPVEGLTPAYVLKARDKALSARRAWFANSLVAVLSVLCNWGRPRGMIDANPAEGVPKIRRPRSLPKANRPWTPAEEEAVMRRAGHLAVPIALARFAGMRQGDAISVPWSAYDGRALRFQQGKTGGVVELPVHPSLKAILDTTPRTSVTIAATMKRIRTADPEAVQHRVWTGSGFRASFFKLIRQLRAEGLVGPGLTFHGLRHTCGTWLAEAGADTRTIAAWLGQKSENMARHYSEQEDTRRRTDAALRRTLERKRDGDLQTSGEGSANLPGKAAGNDR